MYGSGRYILIPLVTNFPENLTFIIGCSFTVCTKKSEKKNGNKKQKIISIGSYLLEERSFGTLITSTKVFSLINGKTLCQNDPLPRDFRI